MISNAVNCQFIKSFTLDYFFQEKQYLWIRVWDIDDKRAPIEQQELIGGVYCTLGDIIGSRTASIKLPITNGVHPNRSNGFVVLSAEQLQESSQVVSLKFRGKNLEKKDFFGKSDPFLTISRYGDGERLISVCKTDVVRRDLNPKWATFKIPVTKLCNGEFNRRLILQVFDWNRDGNHDFIGSCATTLDEMLRSRTMTWELRNEKKKKKKKGSGQLILELIQLFKEDTFLDYLRGGCELSLIFSIDFTGSNGRPTSPNSLHYINPYRPNEYQSAIAAVGSVVESYDSRGYFPAWGFGARIGRGPVSHLFSLNGNSNNPLVQGVKGVLDSYMTILPRAGLSGPTNFGPTLSEVRKMAEAAHMEMAQQSQRYFVLVIITDGIITDMTRSIDEIVKLSSLPVSIIIVGVGDADFEKMEVLDADDNTLSSRTTGAKAKRDIVQFVPFRKFKANSAVLASKTLEEVPQQFLDYFIGHHIKANEAVKGDATTSQTIHGESDYDYGSQSTKPQPQQQPIQPIQQQYQGGNQPIPQPQNPQFGGQQQAHYSPQQGGQPMPQGGYGGYAQPNMGNVQPESLNPSRVPQSQSGSAPQQLNNGLQHGSGGQGMQPASQYGAMGGLSVNPNYRPEAENSTTDITQTQRSGYSYDY